MRTKRIASLLISLVMIFSMASPVTKANDDTLDVVSEGIASSEAYLRSELEDYSENGGVAYGCEWYFISLLRAGKEIDDSIKDEYISSVYSEISEWTEETKATDAERTMLSMTILGEETNAIAPFIYNNSGLSESSNALAYALIALDASETSIPETAVWSREKIISQLLTFSAEDGGFGLYDNTTADPDVTAICLQALAPYREIEEVENAVSESVGLLKNSDYPENPATTAQILLALSVLGEVSEGEFSETVNLLETYRNPSGKGYGFNGVENTMTTVQILQAYDAYRKFCLEGISYWDFSVQGNTYDDTFNEENTEEDTETAVPVNVFVTIASDGNIVESKDGVSVAQAPVTVSDIDGNGRITVDEALYLTHELYYEGGADEGYASYTGTYGLSLARLWGKGSVDEPVSAGYWLNNASCWSPDDEVSEGDFLTAFNYYDTVAWSDSYSYFTENTVSAKTGDTVTLELLHQSGYDESWAPVFSPCADAEIIFADSNNGAYKPLKTDSDGKVKISFKSSALPGDYYVIAYSDDKVIVPAVCRITLTSDSETDSSSEFTAYIKVADPKGEKYLPKTKFEIERGTTALQLLEMTGLELEITKSLHGSYVSSIEGLGEFDEGSESGWMYRVNGEFPGYSISSYRLSDKDYVEVLYTRNLGEDLNAKKKVSSGGGGGGGYTPKTEKTVSQKTYESTASYLTKTVTNPTVGAVGGEWTVLGLARSGAVVPDGYFDKYYENVLSYVKANDGVLHSTKYTEYSRVALALGAIGKNPENVGGYNLVKPLLDYDKVIKQGINGPVWALIALNSRNYDADEAEEKYINYILEHECSGGGWALSASGTAESDITAMTLIALSHYRDKKEVNDAVNRGIEFLSEAQNSKGGYSAYDVESSESAAQVLTALSVLGISDTDKRFVKNGKSVIDNILSFSNDDGSFSHIGESDIMATEQCFYALVSAKRLSEGKTSVFDMSDVEIVHDKKQDVSGVNVPGVIIPGRTFDDISAHECREAVEALAERGIINGTSEKIFEPDRNMTRAEFTALVVRASGLPIQNAVIFSDIESGSWYEDYVNTAYLNGIVKGVSETEFNPCGIITKEQAAVMIERMAVICGMENTADNEAVRNVLAEFVDYTDVSEWAKSSVAFCYSNNILDRSEIYIYPFSEIKRYQIAEMLYNMFKGAGLI